MGHRAVRVFFSVGLFATSLTMAGAATAAGDVVVSVSPTNVVVGQPVEVLVRTFQVVEKSALSVPFESPIAPYPVPPGVWNILYSWPDYPFDVVALHEDGTEVPLILTRDPADSTIWRGVVSLPKAGSWTIWVRNFQNKELGSTAAVTAHAATSSTGIASAIDAGPAALIGGLLGLLGGVLIGSARRRRHPS
jgi:hypothetical protein